MPKSPLVMVLCLVLGLGGGLIGGMLSSGPGPAPSPGGRAAAVDPDGAGGADLARRLALLEERVAALPAATAAPAPQAAPAAAAPPSADSGPGDASLAARIERIEKQLGILPDDLTKVSTEELKALFQKGSENGKNNHKFVGVLEELLRRGLPEEEARKLQFQLGYGYRGLGQHAKEEALFREMARTLPQDSNDGQNATFQLAWSRSFQKDLKEAGLLMEQLVNNPAAGDPLVTNCLYQAGRLAKADGDFVRARAFFERLVGPDASRVAEVQKGMIAEAKQALADMEGK